MHESLTDEQLMAMVREREDTAFETLVRRHEERAFNIAFRTLGRREDARDVVQELFIRIWEKPSLWNPTALFTTWLYRVVVNRSLGKLRFLKIRAFVAFDDLKQDEEPEAEDEPPDSGMVKSEQKVKLRKVMKQLPDRQRLALIFRYEFDFSVQQIADSMEVSQKSAESLLFRGKQALKKLMEEL